MNFASYDFWSALIGCFVVSRLILTACRTWSPANEAMLARCCLLATGLLLLALESWLTLGVFLWVVGLGWLAVLMQSRAAARSGLRLRHNIAFVIILIGQLLPLAYYKYWNFAFNEILGWSVRVPSLLIPMGLSFYTFQTIGFWVDQLRHPKPIPSFINYLNFSSFFPQVVAGPIEKSDHLLPQIESCRFQIQKTHVNAALGWIILGLAYKLIIADNVGSFSADFTIDPANAWHVWFECFAFGLRIYFDFAGYSFIAVGLGLVFGVKLTLNFRCPYWANDLREFWRNWHVTLGVWLRDYIYLPLGGRRVKWWIVNTLIVFVVSGIWHGAGWGFLIWGILHGAGVVACGFSLWPNRLPWIKRAVTFAYVTFAWLFFLERDSELLRMKAVSLFDVSAYNSGHLLRFPELFSDVGQALAMGLILICALGALFLEGYDLRRGSEPYASGRRPGTSILLVFLTVWLAPMEESEFIYFNF